MLHVLQILRKPLPVEYLFMFFFTNIIMAMAIVLSMAVATNAGPLNQQQQQQHQLQLQLQQQHQQPQQPYNYKQQLQYQMQQQDKFEYQQHMKQQQLYYQHQYQQQHSPHEQFQHEQQQVQQQDQQHQQLLQQQTQQQLQAPMQHTPPTAMALMQQHHQQQQQQQQQQQSYLSVRPTQMLQTAATVVRDDAPQADALRGQPEYPNSGDGQNDSMKRRPVNRKRKRRPHIPIEESADEPAGAVNSMPYWRNRNEENNRNNNNDYMASSNPAPPEPLHEMRHSSQANVRRRKPPAIREPLAALEKEQKLYELRNTKPDKTMAGSALAASTSSKTSENLKNILKNNGGLSLSEILQQKNLSLDDLLKGKQNALQALQTTATSPAQKPGNSRFSTKPKLKTNSNGKTSVENANDAETKERSKLTALQKLKLFGSSSRPSGTQVGLADHLTTRKKEAPFYTTTSSTSTTTLAPSTTRIPLYKKILHQRSTLKPSLLLKNYQVVTNTETTEQPEISWDHDEIYNEEETAHEDAKKEEKEVFNEEDEEEENEQEPEYIDLPGEQSSTIKPSFMFETTTLNEDLTTTTPKSTTSTSSPITPLTTTTAATTTSTTTTTEHPTTTKELTTSTRRMYTSTRGFGRTTNRFTTSTTTPSTTTSTAASSTTTLPPQTTTTTTSTTTASSSTMNLTPKANLNLNTEDIRERIQETLLKNLIEKEDTFRKPTSASAEMDADDDLENFFEESVKPKTTKPFETSTITTRMKQFSSLLPKPTQNVNVLPDFDNVDDRTDLLELIEDRRSGNRLFKVLEQRNMTLEELIEHRKRGSSQLHLATIVQTPSRFYPDKKVVLQDNMDIVTAFENFPHFNLLNLKSVKPDEIKTDSQGSSYFTSIIDIEPTDEVYTNGKALVGGGGEAAAGGTSPLLDDKVAFIPDRSDKSLNFFPSWKTLALASLATTGTTKKDPVVSEKLSRPFYLAQPKMLLETPSDEDDYEIKENELVLINHDAQDDEDDEDDESDVDDYRPQSPVQAAVRVSNSNIDVVVDSLGNRAHDLVDLELSGHGFKRSPMAAGALSSHKYGNFYANMPAGIKSAIVASATIVLTALITFMVIFAVCRWKQKRHRMTNIMKSYNAMKSKLPAIATTAVAGNAATRHSSLREMNSLMGGSGLSVNATITTTTTGVPNTPSPAASQTTIAVAATAMPSSGVACQQRNSSGGSKLLQQQHQQHLQSQHLQRHSSLLIQRLPSNENPTNLSILSNCNLADLKRSSDLRGSTTSLSFSLTNGHNISPTITKNNNPPTTTTTTHNMNTMDANSPEVQEYLFDTLRNSF